jgi:hypothetical protein
LRRLDSVIRAGSIEFIINNLQFVINYYICRSADFFFFASSITKSRLAGSLVMRLRPIGKSTDCLEAVRRVKRESRTHDGKETSSFHHVKA